MTTRLVTYKMTKKRKKTLDIVVGNGISGRWENCDALKDNMNYETVNLDKVRVNDVKRRQNVLQNIGKDLVLEQWSKCTCGSFRDMLRTYEIKHRSCASLRTSPLCSIFCIMIAKYINIGPMPGLSTLTASTTSQSNYYIHI